ncbi:MAG: lysophospholipid acyltransferase family protein [Actinomycetes bacterium]
MSTDSIIYAPPTGKPLGTNSAFKFCAVIVIPILNAVAKRQWRGGENIPKHGAVIIASNHVSYSDVLFFVHFLYKNGRAPRFIGKQSVFDTPIIGRIVKAAGQIPVDRESKDASKALDHAAAALKAGHCVGIYPEGTLTRDEHLWPMVAKTGIARLALMTGVPVIPVAAWGPHKILPRYGKKPHLWPRVPMTYVAGTPVNLSKWVGQEDNPQALIEATAEIMRTLRQMLEEIRGEKAPLLPFDPHTSDLPRTGKFQPNKDKKK